MSRDVGDNALPPETDRSEEQQRAYYDRIAVEYDSHYGSQGALEYRDWLFDRIFKNQTLDGLAVLDAMCGGGQNSRYFLERGCSMSAIDISEKQVEQYRLRYPGSHVICGSAVDTPFPDNRFDIIVTDSLHHVHPRVSDAMDEFHRLLKPGGRLVVWEPSAGSVLDLARRAWYRLDRRFFEDNEESIDVHRLLRRHAGQYELTFTKFGGNFAYVFVVLSMALRIPLRAVAIYARPFLFLERLLTPLQSKITSLWVLAEFTKRK